MHVKIQRVAMLLFKEKKTQANEEIDLQGLSDEYWGTTNHEFIVQSQS